MHRKSQFFWGAAITILSTTAGFLIAPIEVRYLQTLTSSPVLIGFTYGFGSVLFGLLAIYLGRLSDKVGRNKFILLGAIMGILYPLLYASVLNIYQYMGVKLGWAFASVSTGPIFMAYLQELLKKDENKAEKISIVYSLQSIGGAAAMWIGGYLSQVYGFAAPYIALSASFIVVTALAFKEFRFESVEVKETESRSMSFGLKYIMSKPALMYYFMINSVYSLNFGIKYLLYPLIIYGMTQSDLLTGSIMGTQGIVAFIVLLFAGKLTKRIGVFKSSVLLLLILSVSGTILGLTGSVNVFWIAAGAFAVGEALWGPVQAVLLIDNIDSKYRGEILGLDSAFDTMYNSIAPLFAGFMLTIVGPQRVLLLFTLLLWIVLAGSVVFRSKVNRV